MATEGASSWEWWARRPENGRAEALGTGVGRAVFGSTLFSRRGPQDGTPHIALSPQVGVSFRWPVPPARPLCLVMEYANKDAASVAGSTPRAPAGVLFCSTPAHTGV